MNMKDLQAFIPGWNIIYMIRIYQEGKKQFRKQEEDFASLQEHSARDLELAKSYASQRDAAERRGDSIAAKRLDNKIAELALFYIDRISPSN